MIASGWSDRDWPPAPDSKLSTEDNAVEPKGVPCSNLKWESMSLARDVDGIESWSVDETVESGSCTEVVASETVIPPSRLPLM